MPPRRASARLPDGLDLGGLGDEALFGVVQAGLGADRGAAVGTLCHHDGNGHDATGTAIYDLFYPSDYAALGFKSPIVTCGNGTGGSPAKVSTFLRHLASYGFTVIASTLPNTAAATAGTPAVSSVTPPPGWNTSYVATPRRSARSPARTRNWYRAPTGQAAPPSNAEPAPWPGEPQAPRSP